MNNKSIWMEEQNKPTLVVKDLALYVDSDIVYESLLRRGVFKWLAVRRGLIRAKNKWKLLITNSINEQKLSKDKRYYAGFRKGIELCRKDVRALCHSQRWQAPDFDKGANEFLRRYESRLK